jgi:tetratricopeptide (TPR) repeat protein
MVNSDNGQIMNEIIRGIAREYQWEDYLPQPREVVSVDAARLREYAGRFQVNPDRVLTVTREGGRLFAEPTASPKFELFPVSENEFVRKDAEISYTFAKGASGVVDTIKLKFAEGGSEAPRMPKDAMVPYEQLMAGKLAEAVEGYKKIKKEKPLNAAVQEARLNDLGYSLMRDKRVAEAIAVFKVNVELYPQSSNAYDSLGEAYLANGDKVLAEINYTKSLELDPHNQNAASILKKLQP